MALITGTTESRVVDQAFEKDVNDSRKIVQVTANMLRKLATIGSLEGKTLGTQVEMSCRTASGESVQRTYTVAQILRVQRAAQNMAEGLQRLINDSRLSRSLAERVSKTLVEFQQASTTAQDTHQMAFRVFNQLPTDAIPTAPAAPAATTPPTDPVAAPVPSAPEAPAVTPIVIASVVNPVAAAPGPSDAPAATTTPPAADAAVVASSTPPGPEAPGAAKPPAVDATAGAAANAAPKAPVVVVAPPVSVRVARGVAKVVALATIGIILYQGGQVIRNTRDKYAAGDANTVAAVNAALRLPGAALSRVAKETRRARSIAWNGVQMAAYAAERAQTAFAALRTARQAWALSRTAGQLGIDPAPKSTLPADPTKPGPATPPPGPAANVAGSLEPDDGLYYWLC